MVNGVATTGSETGGGPSVLSDWGAAAFGTRTGALAGEFGKGVTMAGSGGATVAGGDALPGQPRFLTTPPLPPFTILPQPLSVSVVGGFKFTTTGVGNAKVLTKNPNNKNKIMDIGG